MPRLVVVEHEPGAPAGLLGAWAASRALTVRTVRLHTGEPLPDDSAGWDGAVVLGSEQTAYDDTVPWLAGELAFLERLLRRPVPVLGICFGGQVLARLLGARLYRLATPEIGWVSITSRHPALAAGPWLSWHQDAFGLPPGATELACGGASLQAFAAGPHVGLQFHPEATAPIVASWLAGFRPPPDRDVARSRVGDDTDAAWEQAAGHAPALFSAWFDGAFRWPQPGSPAAGEDRRSASVQH